MEKTIRIKRERLTVVYNYYKEEPRMWDKEPFSAEYELEEIAGLDPDFFTKEFKTAIINELEQLRKQEFIRLRD